MAIFFSLIHMTREEKIEQNLRTYISLDSSVIPLQYSLYIYIDIFILVFDKGSFCSKFGEK